MAIAPRLRWYLEAHGVEYELIPHPHSATSAETARSASVPLESLAKPVLLEDELGYVMAIVPASRRVDVRSLSDQLHRDLSLAKERELEALFHDCERGAVPPLGSPYRVPTVYDDALAELGEVCFEAGDHEDVVRMRGDAFLRLLEGARHGRFSVPY
jgi:Ala-tRNA(Pro) deacylase